MSIPSQDKLAIHGGPLAVTQPPPAWPPTTAPIRAALERALNDQNWGVYHGPWLDQLVDDLGQRFGCQYAHACSSGTVAVEIALRGVSVKPGDEVILAGYDFPGNFRAIESVGAFPVLVDVVKNGWVIDPDRVVDAVSDKTKAIIVSHLHGQAADIKTIRKRLMHAAQQSIAVVEDVCQMPGASIDSQPLGTFGDVSVLSFGGSKLLSAGRGGAVLTNDAAVAQRVKIANDRGNEAYPLSQLQAIVLGPQLNALDQQNQVRNQHAERILSKTQSIRSLSPLRQTTSHQSLTPAFFKLPFRYSTEPTGWSRDQWLAAAQAEGVPIDSGFRGFTNRSARRCRKIGELTHSKDAAARTVLIHHPIMLTDTQTMDQIAAAFQKLESAAVAEPPPQNGSKA